MLIHCYTEKYCQSWQNSSLLQLKTSRQPQTTNPWGFKIKVVAKQTEAELGTAQLQLVMDSLPLFMTLFWMAPLKPHLCV